MLDTVQIIFGGMDGSEAVRTEVRAWLLKLAPLTQEAGVTGGHVLIDASYQHRHGAGWRYQATLEMTTSPGVMAIAADCTGNNSSDDIYVAVRNVFRCLRRALTERVGGAAGAAHGGPRAIAATDMVSLAPLAGVPGDSIAVAPLVPLATLPKREVIEG